MKEFGTLYVGILDGRGNVWGVRVPDIVGCAGGGKTAEEAVSSAVAAMRDLLADYAASILLHFGLGGRACRVSDADDECYDTLAGILADADGPDPRRNLFVRAHLGNYALWLAGLFPDYIEHRRWRRGGPSLDYYDEMGQRGFRLAAEHRLANEHGLEPLFTLVADRFPVMRVALNRVSDTLLFPSGSSPERVMRQVRDEVRWRH